MASIVAASFRKMKPDKSAGVVYHERNFLVRHLIYEIIFNLRRKRAINETGCSLCKLDLLLALNFFISWH